MREVISGASTYPRLWDGWRVAWPTATRLRPLLRSRTKAPSVCLSPSPAALCTGEMPTRVPNILAQWGHLLLPDRAPTAPRGPFPSRVTGQALAMQGPQRQHEPQVLASPERFVLGGGSGPSPLESSDPQIRLRNILGGHLKVTQRCGDLPSPSSLGPGAGQQACQPVLHRDADSPRQLQLKGCEIGGWSASFGRAGVNPRPWGVLAQGLTASGAGRAIGVLEPSGS